MNRLPSGTSDNSRINEATPLLHDEEIVIDDELYALGGAVGGASGCVDEDDHEAQADIDYFMKAICGLKAAISDAIDHSTEKIGDASGCADEDVYEAQACIENLVKAIYGSRAAISDATHVSTEEIDGASACADESVSEAQTDNDKIVKALFLSWLHFPPRRLRDNEGGGFQFLSPKALHAMSTVWRQIKAGRDVLPEPEIIVQGLTETMLDYIF